MLAVHADSQGWCFPWLTRPGDDTPVAGSTKMHALPTACRWSLVHEAAADASAQASHMKLLIASLSAGCKTGD